MARSKRKSKKSVASIIFTIIFIIVLALGYYVYNKYYKPQPIEAKGAISFHFMMLGNDNAGDCIYVRAGNNDILIDAGSKSNSIDDIKGYIDDYVTDGILEYVIVTHAHEDHYAGFTKADGSIFDLYECKTIIDFPRTNQKLLTDKGNKSQYGYYVQERDDEVAKGAKHYTALECYNNEKDAKRVYDLTDDGNVKMEILYSYYYENKAGSENDYSVCVQFSHGDRKFIFTGDLEAEGEKYLIEYNSLTQVEMYKAAHHGSNTSSSKEFLSKIKPRMVVVPCVAGSVEYSDILDNTFPTQSFIDKISQYTDKVYAPLTIEIVQVKGADTPNNIEDDEYDNLGEPILLNGNIRVISDAEKGVYVDCSNNNTILKNTDWFSEYRTMPTAWLNKNAVA